MSNAELIKKLHEYRAARDLAKLLRLELAKIAVELGADQQDAINGGAADFIDGYLAAQGIIPAARLEAA